MFPSQFFNFFLFYLHSTHTNPISSGIENDFQNGNKTCPIYTAYKQPEQHLIAEEAKWDYPPAPHQYYGSLYQR